MNENKKKNKRKTFDRSPAFAVASFLLLLLLIIGLYATHGKLAESRTDVVETETNAAGQFDGSQAPGTPADPSVTPNEEAYVYENTYEAPIPETEDGETIYDIAGYDNSQMLTCDIGRNSTVTVGVGRNIGASALYINPTITESDPLDPDEPYIFVIRCSEGDIQYAGTPSDPGIGSTAGVKFFYLAGRTYDKAVPSSYISEDAFGVKWTDGIDDGTHLEEPAYLYINAVRLEDRTLMGCARITVAYDSESGNYQMSEMIRSDVLVTGEMSESARTEVITEAAYFLDIGNNKLDITISDVDLANAMDKSVVEKRSWFVFNRLFDTEANSVAAGTMLSLRDKLYAVHIPRFGYGYFTVYVTDYISGTSYPNVKIDCSDGSEYAIIGYDALTPFNEAVFNSRLLPEDRDFINGN